MDTVIAIASHVAVKHTGVNWANVGLGVYWCCLLGFWATFPRSMGIAKFRHQMNSLVHEQIMEDIELSLSFGWRREMYEGVMGNVRNIGKKRRIMMHLLFWKKPLSFFSEAEIVFVYPSMRLPNYDEWRKDWRQALVKHERALKAASKPSPIRI